MPVHHMIAGIDISSRPPSKPTACVIPHREGGSRRCGRWPALEPVEGGVVACVPDRGDDRHHDQQACRLLDRNTAQQGERRRDQQQASHFEEGDLTKAVGKRAESRLGHTLHQGTGTEGMAWTDNFTRCSATGTCRA